jgi:hypothetical protein
VKPNPSTLTEGIGEQSQDLNPGIDLPAHSKAQTGSNPSDFFKKSLKSVPYILSGSNQNKDENLWISLTKRQSDPLQ